MLSRTLFAVGLLALIYIGQAPAALSAAPFEIVLVDPKSVTVESVSHWKKEGFKGVALVLDERMTEAGYKEAARQISDETLDLYYWIEVARNPQMATKNPRWMAALGSHQDWQKSFPNFPEPGAGQVAKAFPWVPIGYRETFDAHLSRIDQLLKHAPSGWKGLFLNDLQAGPSSCGCGNLQCRWALDYFVSATAKKLEGDDVAAKFVSEVRKRTGSKTVIPVFTTECAEIDLPADKHGGHPGTGFCGNVGCAHSACAEKFSAQWSALTSANEGPTALLATHTTLNRTQLEFGGGPGWLTNAMDYVNQTLPAHGGKAFPSERFWIVVDGTTPDDESKARDIAAKAGVGGVISARVKIDQSYEPKMLRTD